MAKDPAEAIRFFRRMIADEGCIVITPHADPFRQKERSFLDGIRNTPAAIDAPAGTGDPFSKILNSRGTWQFIWIPE